MADLKYYAHRRGTPGVQVSVPDGEGAGDKYAVVPGHALVDPATGNVLGTTASPLVVSSSGGGTTDTAVHGPDATGSAPTKAPLFMAGVDSGGKVAPIKSLGGVLQTISEQPQGEPTGLYATVVGGITDDDVTTMPFVTDTDGYLYARTLGNIFWSETSAALDASATFTGATRASGAAAGAKGMYSYFNAVVVTDQAGTAKIEASNDGTTWFAVANEVIAANTPMTLQVPVMAANYRVVVENGGAAQTTLNVNSSYSAA